MEKDKSSEELMTLEDKFLLPDHGGNGYSGYSDVVRKLVKARTEADLMPHSKFRAPVKKAIIDALALGMPHTKVSEVAGISNRLFGFWMAAGRRQLDEEGNPLGIYGDFYLACRKAEAKGVKVRLEKIEAIAEKTNRWEGIAWMLERRFPEEFGRPYNSSGNNVQKTNSSNIKITVVHTNDWRDLEKVKSSEEIIDAEFAPGPAEGGGGDADLSTQSAFGAEGSDASGEEE
jgi:hypothetical protein